MPMVQTYSTKKKVLIFVPEFPVLTETFIEREIAGLAQRETLDVQVLSLKKGLGEISLVLNDRVNYRRLNFFDILLSLRFAFIFPQNLKKALSVLKKCEMKPGEKYYTLIKGLGYAHIISSSHPDFMILNFMSDTSTTIMVSAFILGVPYAVSAHAKDVTVNSHCVKQKTENAAFVTICNRHAYESCVSQIDTDYSHKVLLRYHGLDLSKFEKASRKNSIPVIFNIGRLEEKKGHKYLIEAAKILNDRGTDFKIVIVGPGSLYKELSELIDKFGLSSKVEIVGEGKGLPFSETKKYFAKSDIFVFPGINTQEGDADGIANVLLEAAASYLPIVATTSGSTTEFIENGLNGLIVPQRDEKALADALERIIKNPELAESLAEKAHEKVESYFSIQSAVGELEKLILGETA